MIVVHNRILPFGRYSTMNLFGILFTKLEDLREDTLRHEYIHSLQQRELLWIGFYLWYVLEWLVRVVAELCRGNFSTTFHKAYRRISFEQEAYGNEDVEDYPSHRRRYCWWRYLEL